MPFIKPRTPPFATEEEALEFIDKNGFHLFILEVKKYFQNVVSLYGKLCLFMFPLYLGLSSIILLFDYKEINFQIYKFLRAIYIPVQNPYGWNVSFILAFTFNLVLFILFLKIIDFSIIRKIIIMKIRLKTIFLQFLMIFIDLLLLGITLIATLPVKSSSCTLYTSPCWLYSDSMFLYSAILLYSVYFCFFIFIYLLIYGSKANPKFVQLRK